MAIGEILMNQSDEERLSYARKIDETMETLRAAIEKIAPSQFEGQFRGCYETLRTRTVHVVVDLTRPSEN